MMKGKITGLFPEHRLPLSLYLTVGAEALNTN